MLKLTRIERLMLHNQLLILEKLYPDDAEHYAVQREALRSGYAAAYELAMAAICPEKEVLSREECSEVIQIMVMFQVLGRAAKDLPEKQQFFAKFRGFDGNNEGGQLGYCKFLVDRERKFSDLPRGDDGFNSHSPVLETYRRMRKVWDGMGSPPEVSTDQAKKIVEATTHPSRRGN